MSKRFIINLNDLATLRVAAYLLRSRGFNDSPEGRDAIAELDDLLIRTKPSKLMQVDADTVKNPNTKI